MPFPWNRDKSGGTRASRRRRQGRSDQVAERAAVPPAELKAAKERTHKRLSITVGVVLMLVILGIPSFGYYQS